jgi:hypothetical protein
MLSEVSLLLVSSSSMVYMVSLAGGGSSSCKYTKPMISGKVLIDEARVPLQSVLVRSAVSSYLNTHTMPSSSLLLSVR